MKLLSIGCSLQDLTNAFWCRSTIKSMIRQGYSLSLSKQYQMRFGSCMHVVRHERDKIFACIDLWDRDNNRLSYYANLSALYHESSLASMRCPSCLAAWQNRPTPKYIWTARGCFTELKASHIFCRYMDRLMTKSTTRPTTKSTIRPMTRSTTKPTTKSTIRPTTRSTTKPMIKFMIRQAPAQISPSAPVLCRY